MTHDLSDYTTRVAAISSMSFALRQLDNSLASMNEALANVTNAMKSVNASDHEIATLHYRWGEMFEVINTTRIQTKVTHDWLVAGKTAAADYGTVLAGAHPEVTGDAIDALRGFLDWYARLPEPGLVPHSLELHQRLRETRDIMRRLAEVRPT